MSVQVYQETCTRMFVLALSIRAKARNDPNAPQHVNGWIVCFGVTQWNIIQLRMNKLQLHAKQVNLGNAIVREKSTSQKTTYSMILVFYGSHNQAK